MAVGLTEKEVVDSRIRHGANVLPDSSRTRLNVLSGILLEPMFLLLVVACGLYFVTRQYQEGFIMATAMLIVAGISVFQEFRSEKALKALRELTRARIAVLREGVEQQVHETEIVVGDCLLIAEGMRIPADASLFTWNDLSVDESLLTGESLPVFKGPLDMKLFAGTLVVSGSGRATVSAVGIASEIGKLGLSIQRQEQEKTILQQQISRFVKYMALVGAVAFLLVVLLNYRDSHDFLHSLFHGLTLAMAVVPEEIPVAVSTFLALGAYRMIKKNVLVRHPQTVEALGSATVICVDKTGTITQNRMKVADFIAWPSLQSIGIDSTTLHEVEVVKFARLACEPEVFDPMERAIDEFSRNFELDLSVYSLIKEYPLSGRFPMMTHVYSCGHSLLAAVKGAPEGVLSQSGLDDLQLVAAHKALDQLAAQGYRVLAVASASIDSADELPGAQTALRLKLLGFVGFSDPVKENIPDVLKSFRDAGISVKMITGDYPRTACHVAAMAGFPNYQHFLTGEQVNEMDDVQLGEALRTTDVFARSMPDTKLRIIHALKAAGEVVAMTGDGVNDGPALKAAHIGISMGSRGSEVARQSSSLVLLNDDLGGMVEAVAMGRKIYANLKKAIQYIVSIHLPILSVVLLPLVLGWKYVSIFNPIHVIFLELIMGPTCSIVFENEPVDESIMHRKPRRFSVSFFRWKEFLVSLLQGGVIALGLLSVLQYGIMHSLSESATRTLVFSTLVFSNVLLTLTARSRRANLLTAVRLKNRWMSRILVLTLALWFLSIAVEPFRHAFGFEALGPLQLAVCMLVAMVSVLWIELFKRKPRRVSSGNK